MQILLHPIRSFFRSPIGWREFLYIAAGYTLLTLVLTYPVLFHFSSRFMCDGGDGFQNMWNMWWLKKALLELHTNPYYTTYLHYPRGVTLLFQTFGPFNGSLSIPLQMLFRMEVVYNSIVLFSFIASGVGMYYLARFVVGNRLAAFAAGIVYTFSPYHFAHGLGHLQLIAMEWLPIYVLFLLKVLRKGGIRNAVLAGCSLILTSLCSWYYLIDALLLSLLLFIAYFKRLWGHKRRLVALGVVALVYLVVMSPLLGAMLHAKLTQQFEGAHNPETWSADITSFFVPSAISTYGRYTSAIWSKWSGNTAENSNYLGYVVLALAIYALVRVRSSRFWGIAAAMFLILALGPYPRFLGRQFHVPLPYLLLYRYVPFFDFTGVPERFDIMVKFSLAILVGYALTAWIGRPHRRFFARWGVPALLAGMIAIEYLAVPYMMTRVEVAPFYREMAQDGEHYGVIDIPSGAITLYLATIHGKPLVGGYVSRPPVTALQFLRETPIIATLMTNAPPPAGEDLARLARRVFAENDIRYVITHGNVHADFLEQRLRLPPIDTHGGIKVYNCRE